MSLQRFQNLMIMGSPLACAKSLYRVNLMRQLFGNTATPGGCERQLFGNTATSGGCETAAATPALKMERIRLASPIFTFEASTSALKGPYIHCFPLADSKVLWADHMGRPFIFDPEMREVELMPNLHKPKYMPFSLFIPNVGTACCDLHGSGGSLFVMERLPEPDCSTQGSDQFEVFVYKPTTDIPYCNSWQCQLLPPPPYIRELEHWQNSSRPEVSSYAVLGGGSHICISVKGVGTYSMDTASYTWRKVGEWLLPFHGRVEYVPELNLWFGFTAEARHLAAADLSAMDSQPQLVGSWKELCLPEEWKECKDSQLVNLGSGRFCISRFFHTGTFNGDSRGGIDQSIALFTGVEVVPRVHDASGNGGSTEVELQMIPHKSLCHKSNGATIDAVF